MAIKEIKDMFQDVSIQAIVIACMVCWGPIMYLIMAVMPPKKRKTLRKDVIKIIDAIRGNRKP